MKKRTNQPTNGDRSGPGEIEIRLILPNPEQPRKTFDTVVIQEMSDSIKTYGVIQPIKVESAGKNFILHDGECRIRAATLAGLTTIPARITGKVSSVKKLELALVANVQRSDMHPVEEARAYERLNKEFGYDFHKIATLMSKHYTYIMGRMHLLKLELPVQELIRTRKIVSTNETTINALLSLPSPKIQIQMATAFAEKRSSATVIVQVCKQYSTMRKLKRGRPAGKKKRLDISPAIESVMRAEPTNWNALHQLGVVPPWSLFVKVIKQSCADCPLADIACTATCADCGLVAFTRNIIREVPNARNQTTN